MTYDLDFQSQASYRYDPYTCIILKFKGRSLQKIAWKLETAGRTDRQTNGRY